MKHLGAFWNSVKYLSAKKKKNSLKYLGANES